MDATVDYQPLDGHDGSERRKGNLLLVHWRSLCAGRPFPAMADVEPASIQNLWPFCFVAAHTSVGLRFRYLGMAVQRGYAMGGGTTAAGIPPKILALLDNPCRQVIGTRVPLATEGAAINAWGDELRYRTFVCPMSDDGAVLSHLFGLVDYFELERAVVQGVRIQTAIF